jgi:AcrR family transcriptional regulator
MPRVLPAHRMVDIAEAARAEFATRGYRRTQVADVAGRVGISPAALYRHVESKEALFHLCFVDELPSVDGYVTTPAPGETIELIGRQLNAMVGMRRLRRALRQPGDDATVELTDIVDEWYRTIADHWQLLALCEASAGDLPELARIYFRRGRRGLTDDMARYIRLRIDDGSFRAIPDPAVAAMQIRETIAWFAWHRKGDGDAGDLDDERARPTVIGLLVNAMVKP